MNVEEFRQAIERLGLSQVRVAKIFRQNERTVRRWALGEQDVPKAVEICLRLAVRYRVDLNKYL